MGKPGAIDTNIAIRISQNHGATFLAIFGSGARGQASKESDVDLLVAFDKPKSLLDLVSIEREMSDSIGLKVDLLTRRHR